MGATGQIQAREVLGHRMPLCLVEGRPAHSLGLEISLVRSKGRSLVALEALVAREARGRTDLPVKAQDCWAIDRLQGENHSCYLVQVRCSGPSMGHFEERWSRRDWDPRRDLRSFESDHRRSHSRRMDCYHSFCQVRLQRGSGGVVADVTASHLCEPKASNGSCSGPRAMLTGRPVPGTVFGCSHASGKQGLLVRIRVGVGPYTSQVPGSGSQLINFC